MRFEDIADFIRNSPSVSLLRSPNASHLLYFLHSQFKAGSKVAIPMSELSAALEVYLATIRESDSELLPGTAEQYITTWCRGNTRWLRRMFDRGETEPSLQLTPYSEDVLQFVERIVDRQSGVVSTQSRLRMVIDALEDLIAGASDDPSVRIQHLEEQRQRIEDEIESIRNEGLGARYEPAAIRERFAAAVGLLRELLSDFRAVEERFKEIASEVQQRHASGGEKRGTILGYALDAEDDLLTKSDQGITFKAFTRFILSPNQHDRLGQLIDRLKLIEELKGQSAGMATIDRMLPQLAAEAKQVMRTNERLSRSLRRLLDTRAAGERRQLGRVLEAVMAAATTLRTDPPVEVGANIDLEPDIKSPDTRTFWTKPPEITLVDLIPCTIDDSRRSQVFNELAKLEALDWERMRRRIQQHLDAKASTSLGSLIARFPPRVGLVEVLGYLQLAKEDRHVVSPTQTEDVVVESGGRFYQLKIPLVVFLADIKGESQ